MISVVMVVLLTYPFQEMGKQGNSIEAQQSDPGLLTAVNSTIAPVNYCLFQYVE